MNESKTLATDIDSKLEENNRSLLKMILEILPTKGEMISQQEFDEFKSDIKLIRELVTSISKRMDSFELPIISKNIDTIVKRLDGYEIRISKLENIIEDAQQI